MPAGDASTKTAQVNQKIPLTVITVSTANGACNRAVLARPGGADPADVGSTRETSPKVGILAFLHLIIQSQAGCQAC